MVTGVANQETVILVQLDHGWVRESLRTKAGRARRAKERFKHAASVDADDAMHNGVSHVEPALVRKDRVGRTQLVIAWPKGPRDTSLLVQYQQPTGSLCSHQQLAV